jgi:hypothetical protein
MTPEQLTEIPGIGEKMVEKIQLAVASYFQTLDNPPAETESLEGLAEQEATEDVVEEAEATQEAAEAADVAAEELISEEIAPPSDGEDLPAHVAVHGESETSEPEESTGTPEDEGKE